MTRRPLPGPSAAGHRIAQERSQRLSHAVVDALSEHALRTYPGRDAVLDAWETFPANPGVGREMDPESAFVLHFLHWFCLRWRPTDDPTGPTVAEHLLAHDRYRLSREQRRYLEALTQARFTLWQVRAVGTDTGEVGLLDLLTGEARAIQAEHLASEDTQGMGLLAQLVSVRGHYSIPIIPPLPLEPDRAAQVARQHRAMLSQATAEAVEHSLLAAYSAAVFEMLDEYERDGQAESGGASAATPER